MAGRPRNASFSTNNVWRVTRNIDGTHETVIRRATNADGRRSKVTLSAVTASELTENVAERTENATDLVGHASSSSEDEERRSENGTFLVRFDALPDRNAGNADQLVFRSRDNVPRRGHGERAGARRGGAISENWPVASRSPTPVPPKHRLGQPLPGGRSRVAGQ